MSEYSTYLLDGNSFARAAFDPQHPGSMCHRVGQRILTLMGKARTVVCWDTPPTNRIERFDGYKIARRSHMWEHREMFNGERAALQRLLRMIGVPQCVSPGWEADDALATLAVGSDLTQIQTRDEDLLQTITETNHVLLVKGSKERVYDRETFRKERGYDPKMIIDFKSMAGDSSDSVPGVKGLGEKAANEILNVYPKFVDDALSIENLNQVLDEGKLGELSTRTRNLAFKASADPEHLRLMRWVVTCQTGVRLVWARPIRDAKMLSATLAKMGLRVLARRLGVVTESR